MIAEYLRKRQIPRRLTISHAHIRKGAGHALRRKSAQSGGVLREDWPRFRRDGRRAKQLHARAVLYKYKHLNGAIDTTSEFAETPCVVGVKHANPCGIGVAPTIYEAYIKAYEADPVSIFGGIIAANREVDAATAEEMSKIFLEIVVAPSYTPEALEILERKKNIRVMVLPEISKPNSKSMLDMKKVAGGLLVQELDTELYGDADLKVVTEKAPTKEQLEELRFAMKAVKHTKSNGIVLAKAAQRLASDPDRRTASPRSSSR